MTDKGEGLVALPRIVRWHTTGDYSYPIIEAEDGSFVDYDEHVAAMHAYARANVEAKEAEVAAQKQAADYWFSEANKEHNRAERLEAELKNLRSGVRISLHKTFSGHIHWITPYQIKELPLGTYVFIGDTDD